MGEFLLELFSEEIPARMQKQAAADLNRLIIEGVKKHKIPFDSSSSEMFIFSTLAKCCIKTAN